jgi:hypothetical protein
MHLPKVRNMCVRIVIHTKILWIEKACRKISKCKVQFLKYVYLCISEIQVTMVDRQTRWIASCTFFFILINVAFRPSWCMILLICLVLWNEIYNPKLVLLSLFAILNEVTLQQNHSPFWDNSFPNKIYKSLVDMILKIRSICVTALHENGWATDM